MGDYSEEEEQEFFDSREEISPVSDFSSEDCSHHGLGFNCLEYDVWIANLHSVRSRRSRFMECTGLSLDWSIIPREDCEDISYDEIQPSADRSIQDSGAMLRTSLDTGFPVNKSLYYGQEPIGIHSLEEEDVCTIKNSDDRVEFVVDRLGQGGTLDRVRESSSNGSVTVEEFQRSSVPCPVEKQHICREVDETKNFNDAKGKVKKGWLSKFRAAKHILDRHGVISSKPCDRESTSGSRMRRVRVQPCKKRFKELSSFYIGQEFTAHEGSILTMKFSHDGQYLASAGEDHVVRIWQIVEDERLDNFGITETDPSSLYYTMNNNGQLSHLDTNKEKLDKLKKLRSPDLTCVILPPKIFRILEKPLHEFQGHTDDVLDLSWSRKGFLLSSSVDKTVRLWQVGYDKCLRVFSHNNYVTCVAFNPVDDNYLISGSIDGKIRIWEVLGCRVVDYTDIKEIVTAVCYHPDGKSGVVGTMIGSCRFYSLLDNQLHLDYEVFLQGKKKIPGNRITGFQYLENEPNKVMVSSADSQIRILSGAGVVGKLKASGLRSAGSRTFATFTSDGNHVVSVSEDSTVYVWNYSSSDKISSGTKNIRSNESFLSHNSSVAIPWGGIKTMERPLPSPTFGGCRENKQKHKNLVWELDQKLQHLSSDCFSLTRGFSLESLTKGSMTWPEEKLADTSPLANQSTMHKSEFKFLKSACQSILTSPHTWGLVIVAATSDGQIRAYHNYGLPTRI